MTLATFVGLVLLLLPSTMSRSNNPAVKSWGAGLTQSDLMEKDTVIVVDDDDNVVGSASKKDSHVFSKKQPRGILHRAFSVFLFDENGYLLLQQRAVDKITFPKVWTNTCCSHPLHGMEPSEVDSPAQVADGSVPGIQNAARRKLLHELGIPRDTIESFTFLTRLHYWAADTVTHGPNSPWGEHEIDYVLIARVNRKDLDLEPHPEEIDAVRWVKPEDLKNMLNDKDLLFSPWFRLVCERWLFTWWKDLNRLNRHRDYGTIHAFDPPVEHLGGAGNAGPLFVQGDASKKQGAYGKIQTHSESKISQLLHLDEVFSALSLLYLNPLKSNLKTEYVLQTYDKDDLAFCNDILLKVSRSFAAVIHQLPSTLLVDVLVFYLVLRALDTIEDDTTAFENNKTKVKHLLNFHKSALTDPNWSMDGVGAGYERLLLQEFPKCQRIFAALSEPSRSVIADITKRMAEGMAEFVGKDLGQGTANVNEYNRYCHFVAGLVGEGLSRLFATSGLEQASFANEEYLSNQMGLFLQKTNIIRDYLEDYVDKRAFWPQSIWKKYAATGELGYFVNQEDPTVRIKSLQCLNELITDALELVPDCLHYMAKLECVEIFRFCAIPQVMAIATLDKCYANSDLFTGVVKIRKGLSCKLITRTNNLAQVHDTFNGFARSIMSKARAERSKGVVDPNYSRTFKACETICELTSVAAMRQRRARLKRALACLALIAVASIWEFGPTNVSAPSIFFMIASALFLCYFPWDAQHSLSSTIGRHKKTV